MTAVEYQRALGCTWGPGSAPFPHPQAHVLFFVFVFKFHVIDPVIDGPRSPV